MWRNHAHDFLSADISRGSLCDEKFLEIGERRKPTNDLLMGLHVPDKLIREGFHRLWRWDWFSFEFERGNGWDISLLENLANSKRIGLCACKAEAVGQVRGKRF